MEFKPEGETKRGILTGLGQTIAYLRDKQNSASVLVIPKVLDTDDFKIGTFMKKIFDEQIYGKLPIALYSFENFDPTNVVLLCNISDNLTPGAIIPPKYVFLIKTSNVVAVPKSKIM